MPISFKSIALALTFAFGMPLGTSSFAADKAELKKVTICLPQWREEFLTIAMLTAKDKGFFEKQGLDVKFSVIRDYGGRAASPERAAARMRKNKVKMVKTKAGEVPQAVLEDFGVLARVAKKNTDCHFGSTIVEKVFTDTENIRKDVKPLYVSLYGKGYDTHVVVHKNSKIKTVKDLKGKTIRTGQIPTHVALYKLLLANGMDPEDVKYAYRVNATESFEYLAKAKIDAAITYVPTMPVMIATGDVRILEGNVIGAHVKDHVPHALIVANRDYLKKNPEIEAKVFAGLNESKEYLRANPVEVINSLKSNNKMLGAAKWKFTPVVAEKAAGLVGELNIHKMTDQVEENGKKLTVAQSIMAYQKILSDLEFVPKTVDLSTWQ